MFKRIFAPTHPYKPSTHPSRSSTKHSKASSNSYQASIHPSWGFYATVWGVIIGLITSVTAGLVGFIGQITLFQHFVWLIVSLLLIFFSLRFSAHSTAILAFLAGLLLGSFRASYEFVGYDLLATQFGRTVTLFGQLSEDPSTASGSTTLRLQHLSLCASSDDLSSCVKIAGQAYITISSHYQLERSDRVTLQGKLSAGFGTFVAKMSYPDLIQLDRSTTGDIFARFKHWFADRLRLFLPSPEVDLSLGYLMGMKSGLSADFSEALQIVGMTHVVVASGAHLAILTGAAKRLFGKISRFAGLLFSLLLIATFVLIVGFTPSMTRAALVASLSLLMGYVGRKFTPLRLLSFTAMLTLLLSPSNFLNLGWQLSFASFFGLLILAPRLQQSLYGGKTPPWLASMLITSAATCLVCAPILIFNFGSLSLLSFVANLIILPTLPYVMFLTVLTGAASFLPALATLLALPTRLLLDLHITVVDFLSQQTSFVLNLPSGHPLIFLLYLPLLGFLAWPYLHRLYKRRKICYNGPMQIKSEPEMLSLGQFFATHLRTPAIFELIGDVGTGKTTFTRGLTTGLGITEPVTSPSFTISKRYAFPLTEKCCKNYNTLPSQTGELVHYDFYRLGDPGIMRDELAEALSELSNVIVVEWGGDVADLLPDSKYRLELSLNADGTRSVRGNSAAQKILDQFQKLPNSQDTQNSQHPQNHQDPQKESTV